MAWKWKWPDIDAVLSLGLGIYVLVRTPRLPEWMAPFALATGLGLVATGVLLWLGQRWAHWLGVGTYLILAGMCVYSLVLGFDWLMVLAALAILYGAYDHYNSLRPKVPEAEEEPDEEDEDDSEVPSLVLLLPKPRDPELFTQRYLKQVVQRTFGVELSDDPQATECVVGESPIFMIMVRDQFINVIVHAAPFFDEPDEVADDLSELRVAQAVRDHTGYVSLGALQSEDERAAYRTLGKLAVALAEQEVQPGFPQPGTRALAVVCPPRCQVRVLDETLQERLRGDDPLSAFEEVDLEHPPVVGVESDDPRMQAAVAMAKRRWPEFVRAFGVRKAGETFGVKTAVHEDDNMEFMWVKVERILGDTVHGTLDNEPVWLKHVRHGDPMTVPREDIVDWLYTENGEMHGGFTVKVLQEIHGERREQE